MGQKLSERWGKPVVVENKPGASAIIGTQAVVIAPPDGYTFLLCNITDIALLPVLNRNLPYDPLKDLAPVTYLVSGPLVLVVNADFQAKTLRELVAHAKSRPNQLSYGSVGPGTSSHVAGEMLGSLAGIELIHVPYKGGGPVINDLLGGQITMAFVGISAASSLISAGKLRALGVSTTKRSGQMPDTPTIDEVYQGFELNSGYGILAPASTPKDIIGRLYAETAAILRVPEVSASLRSRGSEIVSSTPEEFGVKISGDFARFQTVVKPDSIRL